MEQAWGTEGWKFFFSTLKGLPSSADALWQNILGKLSWGLPVL